MVRGRDPQAYWLLCALVHALESSQEPSAVELELVHRKEAADKRKAATNSDGGDGGLWQALFRGGLSPPEETEAMWEALCVEGQGLVQGLGPGSRQSTVSASTSNTAQQQHRLFAQATEDEGREEEAAAAKVLDQQYYDVLKQLGLLSTSASPNADATGTVADPATCPAYLCYHITFEYKLTLLCISDLPSQTQSANLNLSRSDENNTMVKTTMMTMTRKRRMKGKKRRMMKTRTVATTLQKVTSRSVTV